MQLESVRALHGVISHRGLCVRSDSFMYSLSVLHLCVESILFILAVTEVITIPVSRVGVIHHNIQMRLSSGANKKNTWGVSHNVMSLPHNLARA